MKIRQPSNWFEVSVVGKIHDPLVLGVGPFAIYMAERVMSEIEKGGWVNNVHIERGELCIV